MSSETSPVGQTILDDIRFKTGYDFAYVSSIDTRDRKTAEAVLPILRKWVPSVTEDNYRHAIFSRFVTPHAAPYFDSLVSWWQTENYLLASNCLAQALAVSAKPEHAEQLWRLCRTRPREPLTFMILAKLATFPSVASEVRDTLVDALRDPTLTTGDLQYIAQVDDPRIRAWFESQLESPNRPLRQLARRVVARGNKLPKGVSVSAHPPNRTGELYSAELDLEELPSLLRQLGKEMGLKIPVAVKEAVFLGTLQPDQWVVVSAVTVNDAPANLWFRMEDVDTVELVLTNDSGRVQ